MDEQKIKAVELLVQSLQQYILLDTALITGLLTYYSTKGDLKREGLLKASVALLVISAVFAIGNINLLVKSMDQGQAEVMAPLSRLLNASAIALFGLGLFFGAFFLLVNRRSGESNASAPGDGMRISDENIAVGCKFTPRVEIKRDANGRVVEVKIN